VPKLYKTRKRINHRGTQINTDGEYMSYNNFSACFFCIIRVNLCASVVKLYLFFRLLPWLIISLSSRLSQKILIICYIPFHDRYRIPRQLMKIKYPCGSLRVCVQCTFYTFTNIDFWLKIIGC
jgi:hypothetical protein